MNDFDDKRGGGTADDTGDDHHFGSGNNVREAGASDPFNEIAAAGPAAVSDDAAAASVPGAGDLLAMRDADLDFAIAEYTAKKQRGRPFVKGRSGNPFGRPKGAKNKATLAAQALIDADAGELTSRYLEIAKSGDPQALRWLLERVIPPKRANTFCVDLPKVETIEDLPGLYFAIVEAIRSGEHSREEIDVLLKAAGNIQRGLQVPDTEGRLKKLEEYLARMEIDI